MVAGAFRKSVIGAAAAVAAFTSVAADSIASSASAKPYIPPSQRSHDFSEEVIKALVHLTIKRSSSGKVVMEMDQAAAESILRSHGGKSSTEPVTPFTHTKAVTSPKARG